MREIKFRAWLKDQNKMALVSEWNMWNLGHIFTVDECDFHDKTVGNANYMLLQYTGLKDKNGVEIYEGDIVDFWGGKFLVVYNLGGFGCFGLNEAWHPLGDTIYRPTNVIGNKYENPELLQ